MGPVTTVITRSTDSLSIAPKLVLGDLESENAPGTISHPILGRASVEITLRPARDRVGTLRLLFWDWESAEAARLFHIAPAVFLSSSTLSWMPAAYVPRDVMRLTQQPNGKRWVLEVPFQEVPR